MAINEYELNGKVYYKVYVCVRSKKDIGLKIQRQLKKIESRRQAQGKSIKVIRTLKKTIQRIYLWGLEERYVQGVNRTPVDGIEIDLKVESKLPEILTREQLKLLLYEGKKKNHPWYPVWACIQDVATDGKIEVSKY